MANQEEQWEFYPCTVDGAPASIFLDLGLREYASRATEETLYAVRIKMIHLGEHGMGERQEAEALFATEDAVALGARELGMRYVGRLRNNGYWQLTFMGPAGKADALRKIAAAQLEDDEREFELVSKADADWSYYREFLLPDRERMRWILDRRVVEALVKEGDSLAVGRRVDHWVHFRDAKRAARYAALVQARGFEAKELENHGLQLSREDSVQLEAIHQVTNELEELALEHGGDYDGWEAVVVP